LNHGFPKGATPNCRPWGDMASRFFESCSAASAVIPTAWLFLCCGIVFNAEGQLLLKPPTPGEVVMLMPADLAAMEAAEPRKDLPCTVDPRKPDLGFDLRFHAGYDVSVPLRELAGDGELLTVLFRVFPQGEKAPTAYFVQHFRVPPLDEDAKGDATLTGMMDLGEGKYHVDWLMRDRSERICSSSWDSEAILSSKDKPMPLFLGNNEIAQTSLEPFTNDGVVTPVSERADNLNLKLLVNFAPQDQTSASLQRSDTEALVSILKQIERDPHTGRLSLVAFNIEQGRVLYRQDQAEQIDFPALGKALQSMKLGTVNVLKLGEKHSETGFLQDLIEKEMADSTHPDAVVFAGPKAMLDADVPQDELRRIGDIECPVFYMNYTLNPQAVPWKDSISHAIKAFKGTEYTISRPRDLWVSTTEMMSRIVRLKRQKALTTGSAGTGMQ
jgi:hypothetical protein